MDRHEYTFALGDNPSSVLPRSSLLETLHRDVWKRVSALLRMKAFTLAQSLSERRIRITTSETASKLLGSVFEKLLAFLQHVDEWFLNLSNQVPRLIESSRQVSSKTNIFNQTLIHILVVWINRAAVCSRRASKNIYIPQ